MGSHAGHPLKVLFLEDTETDAEVILDELKQAGYDVDSQTVANQKDYLAHLHEDLDLILADYSLPQFNALAALRILQERKLDIPFIVVTGTVSEEVAVACIKHGASDYLLKDRLTRLGTAVKHALAEKRSRDVQKNTEEALRQSEAFGRAILDSMTQHIAVVNRQGIIISVNDAWQKYAIANGANNPLTTGIGSNYLDICRKAVEDGDTSAGEAYDAIQNVLSGTQPESVIDYCCPTPAGDTWYTMRVMALNDGSGGAVISHGDITEKWRVETALRGSEARFSKAFNRNPIAIYVARLDNRHILDANDSFIKLTGYSRSMVLGHTGQELNIWVNDDGGASQQRQFREYGYIKDVESVLRTKSGERRDMLISAEKIELAGDQCILVLLHDVTDRKRAETDQRRNELLRVELEKEKELRELKDRFISTLSHDFRTPLTVIQASGDLIGQFFDRLSVEKRMKYVVEIQTQVKMMLEMMDEVLVINRAQSGKLQAYPMAVNVVSISRAIFENAELVDTADHDFTFSVDVPQPLLLMDEKLIRHILSNVLSNAVKYSPNGGQISLAIFVSNNDLVFRVTDQGIGISAADQARLFEEFYRAQNTGSIPGTGLGLAIAKRSAEAHGGTVAVESQEGVGTTVTICIPAQPLL